MELAPANREAWSAYWLAADQWRPAWGGMGPLDMAAVIHILRALGYWPEGLDEREELLAKLRVIHAVRLEIQGEAHKREQT